MNEDQLWERLDTTLRMPYGRGQIAAVEEIVRHADALGLAPVQFAARMLGTRAYVYGGEPAKAFVTFAWCLAAHDRGEADHRYDHQLYWHFKWIVNALTRFPEMSLDRTYAVLDDMERRYRAAGHTMNPVHQYRTQVADHVGDQDTAREQYRLWCAAPRGEMSDCLGCEPDHKVRYLSARGRDEEAVALAFPVLSGKINCTEQPHSILTELLVPYLRTGRLDEAVSAHRQAYRAIQNNRAELEMVAGHVAFCAYSGNPARGLELIERHLGWLDEPRDPMADMYFSASAALVLRVVAEAGHAGVAVGTTTAGALCVELRRRALGLAARFDARNGTTAQSEAIHALLSAEPIVAELPLSGSARRAAVPEPTAGPALPGTPEELAALARQEMWLGNLTRVERIWQRFDELCPDPGPELLAHRLAARAAELSDADPEATEAALTRSAELFAGLGDEVARQNMLGRRALVRLRAGRTGTELTELTEVVDTLARIGTPDDHARALARLAMGHRCVDRPAEALAVLDRAAGLATEDTLRARIALDLAECTEQLDPGDLPGALAHVRRAIELFAPLGPCDGLHRAQRYAAALLADTGEPERAAELYEAAALTGDRLLRGQIQHERGRLALNLGRDEEAHRTLSAAVVDLLAAGDLWQLAQARIVLAAAALATGAATEAADAAEEAITGLNDCHRDGWAPPEAVDHELSRARYQLARAYRDLGHAEAALGLLDQVAAHCRAQGNPAGVGQMNGIAGDILDGFDRDAEAAGRYTAAAEAWAEAEVAAAELRSRRCAAKSWHWAGEIERSVTALAAADAVCPRVPAEDPDGGWELALLRYDGARILADAGRLAEAAGRAAAAAAAFRSLDAPVEGAMADALHGRILIDLDRPGEAEPLLRAALAALPAEAAGPRADIADLLDEIAAT
ncbi:MAG TPA: hypothetical protein VFV67_16905 [Actinophytocola sp.]|uniref:hypothetical protein n=1 Tax=Actinophytocola sp. TaxID=1872138 RepID=UPI002DC00AC5|nr:hypothetical protein [Actinophytocola sp.]HEU5472333.1 hypothetical protein [Actinophytocola sp.]